MSSLAVLLLMAAVGLAALHLPSGGWSRRGPVSAFVSSDATFFLFGILLGPVLHVLTSGTVLVLVPALTLAIGWIGARVGFGLAAALPVSAIRGTVTARNVVRPLVALLGPAAALWVLARAVAPVAGAFTPVLPTVLTLASSIAIAATTRPALESQWSAEAVPVTAWLWAALAATVAVAMLQPVVAGRLGSLRWPMLAAFVVAVAGGLAVTLARKRSAPNLLLLIALALGSGAGLALGISPFVAMTIGAVLTAPLLPSPGALEWRLALGIRPIGAALWIVAGATATVLRAWQLIPVAILVVWPLLVGRKPAPLRTETGDAGATIGLAVAVNYALMLGLRDTTAGAASGLMTTASLGLVGGQIVAGLWGAAVGRLTGGVARAEVSA